MSNDNKITGWGSVYKNLRTELAMDEKKAEFILDRTPEEVVMTYNFKVTLLTAGSHRLNVFQKDGSTKTIYAMNQAVLPAIIHGLKDCYADKNLNCGEVENIGAVFQEMIDTTFASLDGSYLTQAQESKLLSMAQRLSENAAKPINELPAITQPKKGFKR